MSEIIIPGYSAGTSPWSDGKSRSVTVPDLVITVTGKTSVCQPCGHAIAWATSPNEAGGYWVHLGRDDRHPEFCLSGWQNTQYPAGAYYAPDRDACRRLPGFSDERLWSWVEDRRDDGRVILARHGDDGCDGRGVRWLVIVIDGSLARATFEGDEAAARTAFATA
jgi:hypothetical protein